MLNLSSRANCSDLWHMLLTSAPVRQKLWYLDCSLEVTGTSYTTLPASLHNSNCSLAYCAAFALSKSVIEEATVPEVCYVRRIHTHMIGQSLHVFRLAAAQYGRYIEGKLMHSKPQRAFVTFKLSFHYIPENNTCYAESLSVPRIHRLHMIAR
jgi:hypothetical protein